MNHYGHQDKATEMYEQAMEVIHGYVGDATDSVEELSTLVDELVNADDRNRADDLIGKIIRSLEKVG